MRLLFDTHTLLWYTLNDPKLSGTARGLILDATNEVLVSPASYWEIAVKISIGKLTVQQPFGDFIDACTNQYGFGLLPIYPEHTVRVASLPFPTNHKDPFDRLLVAQALVESIPLVSNDPAFGCLRNPTAVVKMNMDSKQLSDALDRLFSEGYRIVFWHDPEREFVNSLPFVMLEGVSVLRLDQVGGLEAKLRLEQDTSSRFLVYSPAEEPEFEDDWLLDVRLYSRSFRADRASIILDQLGLASLQLRHHIAARRKFFDNKDRVASLKKLVSADDNAADLDRKMLAVVTRAEQPELFNLVRTIFHAFTEESELNLQAPPPVWEQVEKFELDVPFWQMVKTAFGYSEEAPTLANFLVRLFVTDYAQHLGDLPTSLLHLQLPPAGRSNAVVCLAQWRDSASRASSYDLLSEEVAGSIKIADYLHESEIETLLDVPTFLEVEKAICRGLRSGSGNRRYHECGGDPGHRHPAPGRALGVIPCPRFGDGSS